MVLIKKAPAGYIAQLYRDSINKKDPVDVTLGYLGVTGKWSFSREVAVETLSKELDRERAKAQRALDRAQARVNDLSNITLEVGGER